MGDIGKKQLVRRQIMKQFKTQTLHKVTATFIYREQWVDSQKQQKIAS